MADRQAAMKEILKWIQEIAPNSGNIEYYERTLGQLSDADFDAYMRKLQSGEETLPLIVPNLSETGVTVERNIDIAEKLGHSFYERLWLTDASTGTTYLTPLPYLVVDLPVRRQAQLLAKKLKVPKDDTHADALTDQPMGPSEGASLSFPELQTLDAQGLDKSIEEMIRFRGGDSEGFRQLREQIIRTGHVNLDSIESNSRVKSTETLATFLSACHLENNL